MFALNSLRLEKGYRGWKADNSSDYSLLEAGLGHFINWEKPEFTGKQTLLAEREKGSARQFVIPIVEGADADAPYMSTLWHADEAVGETTSGGLWVSGRCIHSAWCSQIRAGHIGHTNRS